MASSDGDERNLSGMSSSTLSGTSSNHSSRKASLDFEDVNWERLDHARQTTARRKRTLRWVGICAAVLLVLIVIRYSSGVRPPNKAPSFETAPLVVSIAETAQADATTDPTAASNATSSKPETNTVSEGLSTGLDTVLKEQLEEQFRNAPSITVVLPGEVLNEKRPVVASQDRSHFLKLEHNGNVQLYRFIWTGNKQSETEVIWSLGTGNIERGYTDNMVRLDERGILYVVRLHKDKKVREMGLDSLSNPLDKRDDVGEEVLWHSNLLPECKNPDEQVVASWPGDPRFNINDQGHIVIQGRCTIWAPAKKNAGRMALLISGLYRTNAWVCESHVEYLAKNPDAESVDIFVYALYEENDMVLEITPADLEAAIRKCYGRYLKRVTVKFVDDVAEQFPGEVDANCGRLHRLQSQLKTLYLSGLEWWEFSVAQGIQYDSVLRIRTDHSFHGGEKPKFKAVTDMKGNELMMTPIAGGSPVPAVKHWFCSNPHGRMDIGKASFMAPDGQHTDL